jgi:transcriptional regulator with XRE-family HTH domain
MIESVQEIIVQAMEQRRMSMRSLARKAGISVSSISRFLSSGRMPQRRSSQALCDALGFNKLQRRQFLKLLGYSVIALQAHSWLIEKADRTAHFSLDLEFLEERIVDLQKRVSGEVTAIERDSIIFACGDIVAQLEALMQKHKDKRVAYDLAQTVGIGASMMRDEGAFLFAYHMFSDVIELAESLSLGDEEFRAQGYIERGNVALMLGSYSDHYGRRLIHSNYYQKGSDDFKQGISRGSARSSVRGYYHLANLLAKSGNQNALEDADNELHHGFAKSKSLVATEVANAFDLAYLFERWAYIHVRAARQKQITFTSMHVARINEWLAKSIAYHPRRDLLFRIDSGIVRGDALLCIGKREAALEEYQRLESLAQQNHMPYQIQAVQRAIQRITGPDS